MNEPSAEQLKAQGMQLFQQKQLDEALQVFETAVTAYTHEHNDNGRAEMLNNMTCERVQLEMSLPNRAGLLSPASEEASADEDLLMLVMPVMVN